LLVGCTRANPLSIDGDGGTGCGAHTDQGSCTADPNCVVFACPGCNGTSTFFGCFDKNRPLPGLSCPSGICAPSCHGLDQKSCTAAASRGCTPAVCCGSYQGCLDPNEGFGCTCASCQGLDETTCKSRSDCRADYCANCNGSAFAGCSEAGAPPVVCNPPPCPAIPCDQITTQTECDARPDCHEIYEPGQCQCNGCCCTFYSRCESSSVADCKGPAFCKSLPPDCGNPACNGMFTVAYANGCYDGCVLATACAP
jgi:hypothetical protein